MKQIVYLAGAVFCLSQAGQASLSCGSGSLASYIALGSGGCTVGTDTFSSFRIPSGAAATAISPSSINVTPSSSAVSAMLSFQTSSTAQAGQLLEGIFSYRVQGSGLTGDAISLSNVATTGDGNVSYIHDFCEAGTFGANGVSGCTGTAGELLTLGPGVDQKTYAAVSFLNVTDDYTLDSGLGGTASGGTAADTFTSSSTAATPEPSLYLLLGLGLTVVGCCKSRLRKNGLGKKG